MVSNIEYINDPEYPCLPEIGQGWYFQGEYWRFPHETLKVKHGDCEDQAALLASMLLAYVGENYDVWIIGLAGQSGGHQAVAFPVVGNRLTILDTAGHFYTRDEYGNIGAKDVRTAVIEWAQWISQSIPGAQIKSIFSQKEIKRFSSLDEFVEWISIGGHQVLELPSGKICMWAMYAKRSGASYIVYLQYFNQGPSLTSIDSILLNGIPVTIYGPAIILGESFTSLPSICEVNTQKTGTMTFQEGITDPSGNQLCAGVNITVTLHTVNGGNYSLWMTLP